MKGLLIPFFLFYSCLAFSQQYKLAVGNNITTYIFTNSSGNNPSFLRPASGVHLSLSKENQLKKSFFYDLGFVYNQFNNVGDVQNIPFSYSTDFIGLTAGLGPKIQFSKGLSIGAKLQMGASTLLIGNQLLQNQYVDLSKDAQFNSLKTFLGYSFEVNQKVNSLLGVFVKYERLDNYNFGSSTLNFNPSTFSLGLSISK